MIVVGVLSGTSCDGIGILIYFLVFYLVDVAVCKISSTPKQPHLCNSFKSEDFNYTNELICFETILFGKNEKKKILDVIQSKNLQIRDVCILNFELGRLFGEAILHTLKKHRVDLDKVDLIGSHGQTIWHEVSNSGFSTLQIGEADVICSLTKKPVVSDFRTGDVALKGQGAPLTSIQDLLLAEIPSNKGETNSDKEDEKFLSVERWIAIQNIGGMGNVSFVSSKRKIISFDTGPGNILMDNACKILFKDLPYDKDGELAKSGKVNLKILHKVLEHPYFKKKPPKTTGRETFSNDFTQMLIKESQIKYKMTKEDILSTFNEITAESIHNQYKRFGVTKNLLKIQVNGGGSKNKELIRRIQLKFPDVPVTLIDDIESDAKEAKLFCLLAYLNVKKRYSNVPSVTGSKYSVILGKYTSLFPQK